MRYLMVCLCVMLGLVQAQVRADEKVDSRMRFLKADARMCYLASRLSAPIGEIGKGEVALPYFLEEIAKRASEPGADKDPSLRVPILLAVDSFSQFNGAPFDPERTQIKFSTKLVGVSLSTVLDVICDQIHAGYIVRKDYIEIVPIPFLRRMLNHPYGPDRDVRSPVVGFYDKVPLQKALNDIAERYGRTIVFSPLAEKELEKSISARLVNVPFPTAVETLADMTDLSVVRKRNVFLVTTKAHAVELNSECEKFLKEQAEKEKAKESKLETDPKDSKKP